MFNSYEMELYSECNDDDIQACFSQDILDQTGALLLDRQRLLAVAL
jgi:hypothetical protein